MSGLLKYFERRWLGVFVFMIVVPAVLLKPSLDAHGISEKKKLEKERSRLINLKKQSEKAKKDLEKNIRRQKQLKKNVGTLQEQLRKKSEFLQRVNRELRYVETLLNKYDRRISRLKERQRDLEEAAESATQILFNKNADRPNPLFSFIQEEKNRYMSLLLVKSLEEEIGGIFSQERNIATKLDDLEDTRKYWERKHISTEKRKKHIETQRKKRERELAQVENEKKKIERRYQKLNRDIADLQNTVAAIESSIRRKREKPIFAKSVPSGFTFPARGAVVTRFGKVKDKEFDVYIENKGIEIKGKHGGGVRAVEDGVVVYQGDLSGFGLVTVIEHTGDIFTVYGKAALYNVKVGDRVKKGQKIGTLNKDSSPIVYFELRVGGKPVNPLKYIKIPRA